ncbi:MAG TPA: hypothetical protein VN903_03775 [Polyangia bacterium]|jgi:hypothetical protein|nr:hypothetical protein [Polyangia bacterium]
MMRLGLKGLAVGLAGGLLLVFVGCGDLDESDPGTAGGDTTQRSELLRRRRPPAPQPPPTTGGGGSTGSTLTTEQVIKAAQTPDGAAIPQPSGPNHTCPEVVVRLGFWSCPTIGDTCASGGRSCVCSRTDGEGQFPSWICN